MVTAAMMLVREAVDGRMTLSAIVDEVICRDYDVDREGATRDVQEVVTELIGHGVLTEVS